MRNLAIFSIIISLSAFCLAQSPKTKFKESETSVSADEQSDFLSALAETNAIKRVKALKDFVKKFPESENKDRALGLIVSGRAETADLLLKDNDTKGGVKLFKLAVKEAPTPVSDELFSRILMQIPTNLYWRGERVAAFEVAEMVKEKISDNAKQLIGLAAFHISVENSKDAISLLDRSIEIDPESNAAYETLGLAHRLDFNLEKSIEFYSKALEIAPASLTAKRRLAEMKRATGKSTEAKALYKEILALDENDLNARTGLILAMFDSGEVVEAELAMNNSLVENPNNLHLIVGAAYFFAANSDGEKAVELAQKALQVEPRYVWSYVALARGLLLQGKPLAAERALLTAKKFGNFPSLRYELASVRLAAGFYQEAAEELVGGFGLKDDVLFTKIGGRVQLESDNFIDLLQLERQASIFQPKSAGSAEQARRLKQLLKFSKTVNKKDAEEETLAFVTDEFVDGEDSMRTHRRIFAANQLLQKKKAFPKILELTQAAIKGVDDALAVESPSSAILADELYDTRKIAMTRGEALIVPEIPKKTLASILRGRIEEISGWALFNQEKPDEAVVRLKRAISILPKESAWLRSSSWRMGTILETEGKNEKALDYYIKGFAAENPSDVKLIVIESLYKKIYGNLDGLKERLEAKPKDESDTATIFVKKENDENPRNSNDVSEFNPLKKEAEKSETKLPEDIDLEPVTKTKSIEESKGKDSPETGKEVKNKDQESLDQFERIFLESERRLETKKKKETKESVEPKKLNPTEDKKEDSDEKESDVGAVIIEQPDENKIDEDSSNVLVTRPRVVADDDVVDTKENKTTCKILVSLESVTIINNGGGLGVLVGVEKESLNTDIKATSSSPQDVEAIFEPEIGALAGRAFFMVRSISQNKGNYEIKFETPCGIKNITVKVR